MTFKAFCKLVRAEVQLIWVNWPIAAGACRLRFHSVLVVVVDGIAARLASGDCSAVTEHEDVRPQMFE